MLYAPIRSYVGFMFAVYRILFKVQVQGLENVPPSLDGRLVPPTRAVASLALRTGAPVVFLASTKGAYDIWPAWADRPQLTGRFQIRSGKPRYLSDAPCFRVNNERITAPNRRIMEEMTALIYQ